MTSPIKFPNTTSFKSCSFDTSSISYSSIHYSLNMCLSGSFIIRCSFKEYRSTYRIAHHLHYFKYGVLFLMIRFILETFSHRVKIPVLIYSFTLSSAVDLIAFSMSLFILTSLFSFPPVNLLTRSGTISRTFVSPS